MSLSSQAEQNFEEKEFGNKMPPPMDCDLYHTTIPAFGSLGGVGTNPAVKTIEDDDHDSELDGSLENFSKKLLPLYSISDEEGTLGAALEAILSMEEEETISNSLRKDIIAIIKEMQIALTLKTNGITKNDHWCPAITEGLHGTNSIGNVEERKLEESDNKDLIEAIAQTAEKIANDISIEIQKQEPDLEGYEPLMRKVLINPEMAEEWGVEKQQKIHSILMKLLDTVKHL